MKRKIEDKLISVGITPNLKGFGYICEALELILKEPGIKMTAVYEIIAEKLDSKYGRVERAIRYTIGKSEKYKEMTNSEFLYVLALLIKREVEDDE